MKLNIPGMRAKWVWSVGLALLVVIGGLTGEIWFPVLTSWVHGTVSVFRGGHDPHTEAAHAASGSHAGHSHASHPGHREESSLQLSTQALRNIGLPPEAIRRVELETFRRSITVPALIVERPGRTRVQVATPMTGVITHVHAVQGEAVEPGTLLFQIRLTHEDLVQAQTQFVKTLGELDVERREITRLRDVTRSGAVAGKLLLEREYARDKLAALLRAQRESLRLHGLSDSQVDHIENRRQLLRELQVFAPSIDSHSDDELKLTQVLFQASETQPPTVDRPHEHPGPLILQQLNVHKGQSVDAGETLCILTDYSQLFIEGMAFEQDVSQLRNASENEWTVDAIFQQPGSSTHVVAGLPIAYLANEVSLDSRTLHFYVRLTNRVTKDRRDADSRYVEWKYLPGQRLQLRVPVEEWPDQIVVPVEAIAREGAESFVFQQYGSHFDRVPVHVKFRDQYAAVIADDGSLSPGDVIAMRGAHQMQMALKNKAGGGVDPHAGHNH